MTAIADTLENFSGVKKTETNRVVPEFLPEPCKIDSFGYNRRVYVNILRSPPMNKHNSTQYFKDIHEYRT